MLFNLEPVEIRAFNAAIKRATKKNKYSADYVEPQDFRYLLKYLRVYYELWVAFESMDTTGEHRITKTEFMANKDNLKQWGIDMSDPEKVWKAVDPHRHAHVLFEEFADWALKAHLNLDVDGDDELLKED